MDKMLHKQKIEILTRLIKENNITLPEALILLQDEEIGLNSDGSKEVQLFDPIAYWHSSSTNRVVYFDDNNSN